PPLDKVVRGVAEGRESVKGHFIVILTGMS
ncbi:hypothetical protein CSUI_007899, partial [Cystoisospora suis]